jgi:hypothetical protein
VSHPSDDPAPVALERHWETASSEVYRLALVGGPPLQPCVCVCVCSVPLHVSVASLRLLPALVTTDPLKYTAGAAVGQIQMAIALE